MTRERVLNVGVIGCGTVSCVYLRNLVERFPNIALVACADLVKERAAVRAREFDISRVCSPRELLDFPDIDVVVNLTVPRAHADVALAAIRAGKSVYNEKPLAASREGGQAILDAARRAGVRVGCAPDTFLGSGLQTCRKLIDEGAIGSPVAATAFMVCHGHESWHPNPDFFYESGGGPVFDMGPYYLTALVHLLGPVRRVTASARISFPERTILSEMKRSKVIRVEVPTHVAGVLDFAGGTVCTLIMSYDVWASNLPRIEVYGTEGTLAVPDPNGFDGPVRMRTSRDERWHEVPLTFPHEEESRGIGVADMIAAIIANHPHRASGELGYHVLDVMQALHEASVLERHLMVVSTCCRPEPVPMAQ